MIKIKRRIFIPLLATLLGWLCGTFLAPLAIELVVWILQPDYVKARK